MSKGHRGHLKTPKGQSQDNLSNKISKRVVCNPKYKNEFTLIQMTE